MRPTRMLLPLLLAVAGCKHLDGARVASVNVPVTGTQNQGSTGFCWAYVTAAYLEQEELARGGASLRLSAEYLGLWHIIDQLELGQPAEDGELVRNALKFLLPVHGVVPESAFHVRFDLSRAKLAPIIQAAVDAFLAKEGRTDRRLSRAEARRLVKDALKLDTELPDDATKFRFEGKWFTPLSFAAERLKFDAGAYVALDIADAEAAPAVYAQQMQQIKKALILGHSVPMNFALFDIPKDGGDWRCGACQTPRGFHVVLVVDYQSAGSPFGFQETDAIKARFDEPVTAWLTKNSFGMGIFRGSSNKASVLARDPFPAFAVVGDDYFRAGTSLDNLQVILPASVTDAAIDWTQVKNVRPPPAGAAAVFNADKNLPKTGPVRLVGRPGTLDPNAVFARDGANLPLGPGGAPAYTCMAFEVTSPAVKAVAIYRPQVSTSPYMVVQEGSGWMTCLDEALGFHKLVGQALDAEQNVLQTLNIGFTIVARPPDAPPPATAQAAPATTPPPPAAGDATPQSAPVSPAAGDAARPQPSATQASFEAAHGGLGDSPDRPD